MLGKLPDVAPTFVEQAFVEQGVRRAGSFRVQIGGRLEPPAPRSVTRCTGAFAAKAVVKPNLHYGFPTGRRECVRGRPHWRAAGGVPADRG